MHPLEIEERLEDGEPLAGLDAPRLKLVVPPASHPASQYLSSALHDGYLFETLCEGDQVKLLINDYESWRLAGAYEQRLGLPRADYVELDRSRVPVQFVFSGIKEFVALDSQPNGNLIHLGSGLSQRLLEPQTVYQDYVLAFDDARVVIIFRFHTAYYLGIHARSLELVEYQRPYWINQFGEESVWIWDEFQRVRGTREMPGWNDFVKFLSELLD